MKTNRNSIKVKNINVEATPGKDVNQCIEECLMLSKEERTTVQLNWEKQIFVINWYEVVDRTYHYKSTAFDKPPLEG